LATRIFSTNQNAGCHSNLKKKIKKFSKKRTLVGAQTFLFWEKRKKKAGKRTEQKKKKRKKEKTNKNKNQPKKSKIEGN